jgi:CheY-like chemotaxis protein
MPTAQPDILLIEDDQAIREALGEVLRDEGYQVQTAGHGAVAQSLLQQGLCPHVILLDLMMPVMDGWQFMRLLRAEPAWSHIPVIILSAAQDDFPPGYDCHLSKPVDLTLLFDAVCRHCPNQVGLNDAPWPPKHGHQSALPPH